jgi:hypothetical protein
MSTGTMIMLFGDWAFHNVSEFNVIDASKPSSSLAVLLDGFAKTLYSSIMLDLGPQHNVRNALLDVKTIDYLYNRSQLQSIYFSENIPAETAYEFYRDKDAPLSEKPAQIYTQYVCSVPELRSGWSLVVSIIVADLVLISAFWNVFNWAATKWLSSKDENWNRCPGCAGDGKIDCEANLPQYHTLNQKDSSHNLVKSEGTSAKAPIERRHST